MTKQPMIDNPQNVDKCIEAISGNLEDEVEKELRNMIKSYCFALRNYYIDSSEFNKASLEKQHDKLMKTGKFVEGFSGKAYWYEDSTWKKIRN